MREKKNSAHIMVYSSKLCGSSARDTFQGACARRGSPAISARKTAHVWRFAWRCICFLDKFDLMYTRLHGGTAVCGIPTSSLLWRALDTALPTWIN